MAGGRAPPLWRARSGTRRAARWAAPGTGWAGGSCCSPRRDLSRGLVTGVIGVIVLYLSVNYVCLRVLSPAGLAASHTPASSVMRVALGERGAEWLAVGIAVSTLGFLSQGILTAPRVYYAMARD